jgi:hypothetical protein
MNVLTPYISRIVAALVGWALLQLGARYGVIVSSETQAQIVEVISNAVLGFTMIYLGAHKTLDKWINPGDAASSHLGASEKIVARNLKATEGNLNGRA